MSFNSSTKAKENHESWESLFRQTLSKERLFTFSRPAENPIHWIQFLDPFDQHDTRKVCKSTVNHNDLTVNEGFPRSGHVSGEKSLQSKLPEAVAALAQAAAKISGESRCGGSSDVPGWPLIPFSKMQMFKCEKCCLEFCSPINHRRHLRTIHRRTLHAEKEDLMSQRQQFATFWDNLSPEEAYKIAAVKNLQVEDLTGEKVARALRHLLQQPSLFVLPHSYVKSGAMLLELVQSRSSRLFLTSSELFKILDGSSEKMFPSFGLNAMQRYVFEGGAGKVGLETKNLVASLSFLVEHNLVKAFIKNKDEEAWRCQTALVEEEEALRRKQAQIQARKDMKKVRQKDKEQKVAALATQRFSDIDLSDDEISPSSDLAGSQTRPSSNTFENLNHQLAGEGIDFDHCLEVVSTAVSSPGDKSLVLLDSNDEGASTAVSSPWGKNLSVDNSNEEVISTSVSSSLEKSLILGDLNDVAEEVGIVCNAFEGETKDSSNIPGTNEGSPPDASGFQKPCNFQKCKYHAERSLSVKGEPSLFPRQKESWKERRNVSFRNDCKQTSASELEEDMDMGLKSSCVLRAIVRDSSANQGVGFRPRQYVTKPLRSRNYQAAAQIGAAVWTKKTLKCVDATSANSPHTEPVNNTSPNVSDSVLHADGSVDSSVEVLSTAPPHDRKSGVLFISSTTVCPNIEPPLCSPSSIEQTSVPSSETGSHNHESSPAALFEADSGQYHQGHSSASIAPVITGSVVIGSVSVPLESVVSKKESALTANLCKELAQARTVVNASERELAEVVHLTERPKETNQALHENGVNKSRSHRDRKEKGKLLKIFSQSDSEWKENNENSHAAMGNHVKPIVVQGGSFAGPKMKIWRPVVSNTHDDCCKEKLSVLGIDSPESLKVSSIQSLVTGGDINDLGIKELEIGQTIKEDSSLICSSPSPEKKSVVQGGTAPDSGCTSTFRAVACYLNGRWFDALHASDSVILSVEAEEDCARQFSDNADVQSKDTNVYLKDYKNPSSQLNKGVNSLPGNVTKSGRLWKQGCSGSAMAVNRRTMGKESLQFTSRYAGYRYVPK